MLNIALQEWAVVCAALGEGRLLLTARKGGIHERGGGIFAPDHGRFALLPSYLHQAPDRLSPAIAADVPRMLPPPAGHLVISLWAEVAQVWRSTDLHAIQALGADLPWTADELATRFAYRGQPFLYLLALRVFRLPTPVEIADDPAYAGCRSWITLQAPIDTTGSVPVIGTGEFGIRCARVEAQLHPSGMRS